MIDKRTVAVGTCDACGREEYANDNGDFIDGYTLVIFEHISLSKHEAFACKETHISKASRAVLERWRHEPNGGDLHTPVTYQPGYADEDNDDSDGAL